MITVPKELAPNWSCSKAIGPVGSESVEEGELSVGELSVDGDWLADAIWLADADWAAAQRGSDEVMSMNRNIPSAAPSFVGRRFGSMNPGGACWRDRIRR